MQDAARVKFHQDRLQGIGGSDAAAALGMSKWKTPFQLYLEKIGETEPEDDTWDFARGRVMEPLLRQHFSDTFRMDVMLPDEAIVHPKYSFMRYNPDGLTNEKVLPEFKTARYTIGWGTPGTDEVPQDYLLQVQHGMAVLGYPVARPSVSIAFGEPVYYEVPANKELQEMIIDAEADFWRRVVDRDAPPPTTNEDVARKFRNVHAAAIMADQDTRMQWVHLVGLRGQIKHLEGEKEKAEVLIKDFMGENDTLIDADGVLLATWKQRKGAERIDSKRLREEQPSIAAAYTNIGDPTRTFLVK